MQARQEWKETSGRITYHLFPLLGLKQEGRDLAVGLGIYSLTSMQPCTDNHSTSRCISVAAGLQNHPAMAVRSGLKYYRHRLGGNCCT